MQKVDLLKAILRIYQYIKKYKINIVHSHLFEGGLAGLCAAKLAGVSKRIYTRHHSTFHHDYFPNMVKYDRLINWLATEIVAISEVVKDVLVLEEKVAEEKVHLIHHGFNFKVFDSVDQERVQKLKTKYRIAGSPVIGVISRWTKWKGIQFIIPAFHKLLKDFPDAQLILANAQGEYTGTIEQLLLKLPTDSFRTITFEEDFIALYRIFDLFVHVPVNLHCEAFGQVYVEALASEIPSIFTLSGIANEFIIDEQHALIVPYESSEAIYKSMKRLLTDTELASKLSKNGKEIVQKRFSLETMMKDLEALYSKQA